MHAVGADDEVESLVGRVLERDVDAVGVLGDGGDAVAVAQVEQAGRGLARRRERLEQHLVEVAAGDLDLGDRALAVEVLHRHAAEHPAGAVDVGEAELVQQPGPDAGHEPHALGDLAAGPAEVDGLAAGAGRGGALDDGGADAAADELQGECVPGDAAAGDQDVGDGVGGHRGALPECCTYVLHICLTDIQTNV